MKNIKKIVAIGGGSNGRLREDGTRDNYETGAMDKEIIRLTGKEGISTQTPEEKQREFESLGLKSEVVLNLFNNDLEGERSSQNLLLVLPAGKAAHIEAGIAYGLEKNVMQ